MREYLDKQKLLMALNEKYQDMSAMPASYYAGFQYAIKLIERLNVSEEVAPVGHARWEWHGPCRDSKGTFWATCSVCNTRPRHGVSENYCPKSGEQDGLGGEKITTAKRC